MDEETAQSRFYGGVYCTAGPMLKTSWTLSLHKLKNSRKAFRGDRYDRGAHEVFLKQRCECQYFHSVRCVFSMKIVGTRRTSIFQCTDPLTRG